MAKQKKFRQLSFEEKLKIIPADRMQEEGSINSIARDEYRKRKGDGTLSDALSNVNTGALQQGEDSVKASVLAPYVNAGTNPTEAINDKIDQAELISKIDGNQNDFSAAKKSATLANDAIIKAGSGLEKLAAITRKATENPNAMSQVTTNDIFTAEDDVNDAFVAGDPDAFQKQQVLNIFANTPNVRFMDPAIEKLGLHDYYPDLGQPIRVGGYSGSIVGSNDIYVAQGGLFPAAIVDARARALQGAAQQKAKLKEKIWEMASVKAAYPYQEQFDTATMNLLNKYGEQVNWDFSKLDPTTSKSGMKMYEELTRLKTLGRVSQELENKGQDLMKKLSGDEKSFVSAEQQKMLDKYFKGDWNVDKLSNDPNARKEFMDLANKWNAYDNMVFHAQGSAKILKDSMDKMPLKLKAGLDMNDPKIAKAFADIDTFEQHRDYDRYTRAMLTFVDDPRIEEAAKGLLNQHRFSISGSEEEKLEKVKSQIASYLGKQIDLKDQIARTNSLGWANLAQRKKENQMFQPYTTLYNNAENPETKGNIANIYSSKLGKAQQTNLAAQELEKVFGGKLLREKDGSHKFEFQLPFKAEKGKIYNFSTGQLFSQGARTRILESLGEGDEELRKALNNPDAVFNAEVVDRKAQYYVPMPGGKVRPITEDDIRKDPTLVNSMKPYAKNEYKVYVDVPVSEFPGKTERKYLNYTANVIDDLENVNARAEYDSDVRESIPTMNRDIKQGQTTYRTQEFEESNIEPDL